MKKVLTVLALMVTLYGCGSTEDGNFLTMEDTSMANETTKKESPYPEGATVYLDKVISLNGLENWIPLNEGVTSYKTIKARIEPVEGSRADYAEINATTEPNSHKEWYSVKLLKRA